MESLPQMLHDEAVLAAKYLKEGKVILYPTDTIWGLGCSLESPAALDRIFHIKNRPPTKSPILLVNSIEMLKLYSGRIHPRIETLLLLHNRPLTVIYSNPVGLPLHVLNQDGSIAIRICKDPFCQKMIEFLNQPIISTSANLSGEPTPKNFTEISETILKKVDHTVLYRQKDLSPTEASTIIRYDDEGEIIIVRP